MHFDNLFVDLHEVKKKANFRRYESNDRRDFARGETNNWSDGYNQGYQSRAGGQQQQQQQQHRHANERYNRGTTGKNYSNSNWGYSNQNKDYENHSTSKQNYSNQPIGYSNSTPNDKDYCVNDPYDEDPYYSNLRNSNSNDNYSSNQYDRYCSEQEGRHFEIRIFVQIKLKISKIDKMPKFAGPNDYYGNRDDDYDGGRNNRSDSRALSGGGHRAYTFTSKNFGIPFESLDFFL